MLPSGSSRPLLPHPPTNEDGEPSSVGTHGAFVLPPKAQRNISVACTTCHKKRCNGGKPCVTCRRLNAECVFDASRDRRRLVGLRKQAALSSEGDDCLKRLLALAKEGTDEDVADLATMIRESSSAVELSAKIEKHRYIRRSNAEPVVEGLSIQDGADESLEDRYPPKEKLRPSMPDGSDERAASYSSPVLEGSTNTPTATYSPRSVPKAQHARNFPQSMDPALDSIFSEQVRHASLNTYPSLDNTPEQRNLFAEQKTKTCTLRYSYSAQDATFIESPLTSESPISGLHNMRSSFSTNSHHDQCLQSYLKASRHWHPALFVDQRRLKAISCTCWRFSSSPGNSDLSSPALYPQSQMQGHFIPPKTLYAFGNLPPSSGIKSGGFSSSIQEQQLQIYNQPEWSIRPMAFDDGSPFCRAYLSYLDAAQAMIRAGCPLSEIFGSERANVNSFFRPQPHFSAVDVSSCATSLVATFTEVDLPGRLAWIASAVRLMKWLITPTAETYAKLSILERPSLVQIMLPHSAVIDLTLHPAVRDALCRTPRDFLTPSKGCSINWPKTIDQAVEVNHADGSLHITAEFQQHALNLENWSFSPAFLETFSEIRTSLEPRTDNQGPFTKGPEITPIQGCNRR